MKVVLDANVLLVIISSRSPLHLIFKKFLAEAYVLCVTTDILLEFEEILSRELGAETTHPALQVIRNAPNTELVTTFFKWGLITADQDDNKFVDCAVSANADYLVTDDKHFNVLKKEDLFEMHVLSACEFKKVLEDTF